MFNRHPQWEVRLNAWLRECHDKEYQFGQHDCMIGTIGGVRLAILGEDIFSPHLGKYRTERGAFIYLKKAFGVSTPEELVDTLFPTRPLLKARRGDLVLNAEGIPGVCLGRDAAFIGFEEGRVGLVTFPMTSCVKAWSVGN